MKSKKLRPLHLPSPVAVRADARGRPTAVGSASGSASGSTRRVTRGAARGSTGRTTSASATGPADSSKRAGMKEVVQIREIWRIDDEWWREPVARLYFDVVLEEGKRTILYRDLTDGRWYRQ